jgi:hypothetical protein
MSRTDTQDTDEVLTQGYTKEDKPNTKSEKEAYFIELARSNFNTAKTYMDTALSTQWEQNADHFNNKHGRRSRYNSKQHKGSSRIFRPLSRASERSSSATAAAALFSNLDVLDLQPENKNDPAQVFSARVMKNIVAYYLDRKIPWYLTVMGAWQDTRVYGPCCSFTDWRFKSKEVTTEVPVLNIYGKPKEDGSTQKITETVVVKDEPYIDLIPVENLLLDPACDWRDPINSSPYVIYLKAMAITDATHMMASGEWNTYSETELLAATDHTYNTVTSARDGDNRPDARDSQTKTEFKSVWIHYNFVRMDGEEYFYLTAGTQLLLTDIKKLEEDYPTGMRPLTYGFSVIEAHKFAPNSPTEIISGLQVGVNDIANLRIDNIRLALNKRYVIRRGATVDLEALMRSVPGGGIVTDDVDKDIKVLDTRDVTGSSYKEQERLETESNDISGTFMGSSIQNNRNLNQTVGGMEMLADGQSALSDMDIRTFAESWVKPQLELLILNIQAFTPDEVIQTIALEGAEKDLQYLQRFEPDLKNDPEADVKRRKLKNDIMAKTLKEKMTVRVNVGLGATSPQRKVSTLLSAVTAAMQLPGQGARINEEEVTKEIFTASGLADGARFILPKEDEPQLTQEDLQAAQEQGMQEGQDQIKLREIEANLTLGEGKLELQRELGYAELAQKENITLKELETRLEITYRKDQTHRDISALRERLKSQELEFKRVTGKPGI